MRGKRTFRKLTKEDVLRLFREGKYAVNLEEGVIVNRDGSRIANFRAGHAKSSKGHFWVYLYDAGARIGLPTAHAVWMFATQSVVPAGFEIHHDDEDAENDRWDNLLCLHSKDHDKKHGYSTAANATPF